MKSPNVERRNPKEARMINSEDRALFASAHSVLGLRHSFVIRHSSFIISA